MQPIEITAVIPGKKAWVLLHVEVQGQKESDFNKRMFVYNFRIFDRCERKVASLYKANSGAEKNNMALEISVWSDSYYKAS